MNCDDIHKRKRLQNFASECNGRSVRVKSIVDPISLKIGYYSVDLRSSNQLQSDDRSVE